MFSAKDFFRKCLVSLHLVACQLIHRQLDRHGGKVDALLGHLEVEASRLFDDWIVRRVCAGSLICFIYSFDTSEVNGGQLCEPTEMALLMSHRFVAMILMFCTPCTNSRCVDSDILRIRSKRPSSDGIHLPVRCSR